MRGTTRQIVKWLMDQEADKIWDIRKHRERRSVNANDLLWHCLDEIARAIHSNKWDVYLLMLKRYGVFTYGVFRSDKIDQIKKMWRETEEIGEIDINGERGVQLLLYFGSSTYDSKQFSQLLNGVISEMEEMGLTTPAQEEADRLLLEWGKKHEGSMEANRRP